MKNVVLVCGGRDYVDHVRVDAVLDRHFMEWGVDVLIQGGARGADYLAKEWAIAAGVHVAEVPPLWQTYGRAAGPKRNAAMLLLRPDIVIAFPGGIGTADMVQQARDAGIDVAVIA